MIITKTAMQLAACVYKDELDEKACIFVQLLSLVCSHKDRYHFSNGKFDKNHFKQICKL